MCSHFFHSGIGKIIGGVLGVAASVVAPEIAPAIAGALGATGALATDAIAAGVGAAGGAASAALTGSNPLLGAATGALGAGATSAFGGAGGALSNALGVSGSTANAIIQGGVGALGSALGGGNPLIGAATGAGLSELGSSLFGQGPYASVGSGASSDSSLPIPPTPPGENALGYPADGGLGGDGGSDPLASSSASVATGDSNASGTSNSGSSSSSGGGGSKNSGSTGILGKLFGGGGANASLALGALNMLGSLISKPQIGTWQLPSTTSGSIAQNLGPYYNTGLSTTPVQGRTAVTPVLPSVTAPASASPTAAAYPGVQPASPWYRYGSMPEQTFFTGNSLANFGFARGGALSRRVFDTGSGQHHVRGPGTATSDSIDARLSDGEYVLDHRDVTRIGHGSNDRGAQVLDHVRRQLDRNSGPLTQLANENRRRAA